MEDVKRKAEDLLDLLFQVWSLQSSSKWTPENPAKGQCGVTSLVVHDILGGVIMKTKLSEGYHFYNRINGQRYDFTESQFTEPIEYLDIPSSREEAFTDTNEQQYSYLSSSVSKRWKSSDAQHQV